MHSAEGTPATGKSTIAALRAYVELFHFPPILMVLFATTAFATIAAGGVPPASRLVPYLLAVLFTQMAIGAHNDYCDRSLDVSAKPWRALPLGVVSPRLVIEIVVLLTGLGLALALPLGTRIVALGAVGTGAGFVYNARLKGTPLAWVPFYIALPALVIASFELAGEYQSRLLLTYVLGLPLVISIYLADQMIDIESDRENEVGGFGSWLGQTRARILCWAGVAIGYAIALLLWPSAGSPGVLFGVSVLLLATAIVGDRAGIGRVHWLGIMLAVIALAADWLRSLPPS
ncbi:MAG: UbiA family prenyltransferase [Chloroflexota bacterium]